MDVLLRLLCVIYGWSTVAPVAPVSACVVSMLGSVICVCVCVVHVGACRCTHLCTSVLAAMHPATG